MAKKYPNILKYVIFGAIIAVAPINSNFTYANESSRAIKPNKLEFSVKDDWINQIIKYNFKILEGIPDYITPELVRAIVRVESDDNPKLISHNGAKGLIQVMPCVWEEIYGDLKGYNKRVFDPYKNIEIGLKYFKWLDKTLKKIYPNWENISDEEKKNHLLVAYNGGITRYWKKRFDINRMPLETRKYVPKIEKTEKLFKE